MDASRFKTKEGRLEEGFRCAESDPDNETSAENPMSGWRLPLVADCDDLPIRQFVALLQGG